MQPAEINCEHGPSPPGDMDTCPAKASKACVGQDRVEGRCELAGAVADEEPELADAVIEIHHEVADLLGRPSAIGVRGQSPAGAQTWWALPVRRTRRFAAA